MKFPARAVLMRAMDRRNYPVATANWHINLIGIRAGRPGGTPDQGDTYNDLLAVLWCQDDRPNLIYLPMTTDPGSTYRRCPINPRGTAILKPGHYPGMWRIGRHRGVTPALVQRGPCTVWRDNNRDDRLDTDGMPEHTGRFGINLHSTGRISRYVGPASGGCQVLSRPKDLHLVLALAAKHVAAHRPDINYTLLNEETLLWTP